jgi:hypothetical protein
MWGEFAYRAMHAQYRARDATPHGMCTPFPVIRCVKSLRRVALVRSICISYCRRQGAFSLIRGFIREAIVG